MTLVSTTHARKGTYSTKTANLTIVASGKSAARVPAAAPSHRGIDGVRLATIAVAARRMPSGIAERTRNSKFSA